MTSNFRLCSQHILYVICCRGSEFCYVPLKSIHFFVLVALAGLRLQTLSPEVGRSGNICSSFSLSRAPTSLPCIHAIQWWAEIWAEREKFGDLSLAPSFPGFPLPLSSCCHPPNSVYLFFRRVDCRFSLPVLAAWSHSDWVLRQKTISAQGSSKWDSPHHPSFSYSSGCSPEPYG